MAVAVQPLMVDVIKKKPPTNHRRVVVTGMGVETSMGHDPDVFYNNLLEGVRGISEIEGFDCFNYPTDLQGWRLKMDTQVKNHRTVHKIVEFNFPKLKEMVKVKAGNTFVDAYESIDESDSLALSLQMTSGDDISRCLQDHNILLQALIILFEPPTIVSTIVFGFGSRLRNHVHMPLHEYVLLSLGMDVPR
ncbi:hypothetical protein AgCh_032078 [Apium graveolens]